MDHQPDNGQTAGFALASKSRLVNITSIPKVNRAHSSSCPFLSTYKARVFHLSVTALRTEVATDRILWHLPRARREQEGSTSHRIISIRHASLFAIGLASKRTDVDGPSSLPCPSVPHPCHASSPEARGEREGLSSFTCSYLMPHASLDRFGGMNIHPMGAVNSTLWSVLDKTPEGRKG